MLDDPKRSGAAHPGALQRTHLMDDPMIAVLPQAHRLANREQISLKQLATERWVVGTTRGPDSIIRRARAAAGIQPNIATHSTPTTDALIDELKFAADDLSGG